MSYVKSNGFSFADDLCRANKLENQLAEYLQNQLNCKATTSQDKKSFMDWDIKLEFPDAPPTTIELKEDRMADSGNIAVELYKMVDGKREDSCLSTSKSDYYAYFFDNQYHLIPTKTLKKLVLAQEYIRICAGGNRKRAVVALFKKWVFLKYCKIINI